MSALVAPSGKRSRPLPDGWRVVRFGDVVRNVNENERDPLAKGIERYVGLEHLEPGSLHIREWGNVADGTTFTRRFRPGQVLFGKRRAYQGKAAVAEFDGVCSGDILALEPLDDALDPRLLPFVVQSDGFFQHALGTSAGSLSPRTRWKDLASFQLPLPPILEQRRVAETLWAADEERQSLLAVRRQVQAVSASLSDYCLDATRSRAAALGSLVDDGTVTLQTGPFGTVLKASSYRREGTPMINPTQIIGGRLVPSEGLFLDECECQRLASYAMREGDILVARVRNIGNFVYVTHEWDGWIVGTHCIRIRANASVLDGRFLHRMLRAPRTREWLLRNAYGTVMPGTSERMLRQVQVCVPDLEVQRRFIHIFCQLDAAAEAVEQKMGNAEAMLRTLMVQLLGGPFSPV